MDSVQYFWVEIAVDRGLSSMEPLNRRFDLVVALDSLGFELELELGLEVEAEAEVEVVAGS